MESNRNILQRGRVLRFLDGPLFCPVFKAYYIGLPQKNPPCSHRRKVIITTMEVSAIKAHILALFIFIWLRKEHHHIHYFLLCCICNISTTGWARFDQPVHHEIQCTKTQSTFTIHSSLYAKEWKWSKLGRVKIFLLASSTFSLTPTILNTKPWSRQ